MRKVQVCVSLWQCVETKISLGATWALVGTDGRQDGVIKPKEKEGDSLTMRGRIERRRTCPGSEGHSFALARDLVLMN